MQFAHKKREFDGLISVGATSGSPLRFIEKFIVLVLRTAFAQTFFGKSLTKNFFERHLGRGLPPPHPHFAHSSDQRLCLWKPPAFLKKSWAKTFYFRL